MFTSVRSRRTAVRLALGLSIALAATGCGGGGGGGDDGTQPPTGPRQPTQPTAPANPVTAATVGMRSLSDGYSDEHRFSPAEVALKRGGTVTWTNDTGLGHNVTFTATDGAPANVATHTSGSNTRTFTATGAFGYSCTNHAGMSGTITVVD